VRYLVVYGIFLASIGACRRAGTVSPAAAVTPPPLTHPTTKEACRSCRGIWAVHGLDEEESCNCRTTDAGKRCRDGADCQGMCVAAERPETQTVLAGPPARGFFIGRCSELMVVLGCNRIIEPGATADGPVPLNEPPPIICQD
jgi:hypothetical protein